VRSYDFGITKGYKPRPSDFKDLDPWNIDPSYKLDGCYPSQYSASVAQPKYNHHNDTTTTYNSQDRDQRYGYGGPLSPVSEVKSFRGTTDSGDKLEDSYVESGSPSHYHYIPQKDYGEGKLRETNRDRENYNDGVKGLTATMDTMLLEDEEGEIFGSGYRGMGRHVRQEDVLGDLVVEDEDEAEDENEDDITGADIEEAIDAGMVNGINEQDVEDIFSYARHSKICEMERLLDRGIPINVRDLYGNTLLIIACQNGNKRVAKSVMRRGADLNVRNYKGNTPLHYCYAYGYGETLGDYLISKGADASNRNNAGYACYQGIG
jgi:hypothetical protein